MTQEDQVTFAPAGCSRRSGNDADGLPVVKQRAVPAEEGGRSWTPDRYHDFGHRRRCAGSKKRPPAGGNVPHDLPGTRGASDAARKGAE